MCFLRSVNRKIVNTINQGFVVAHGYDMAEGWVTGVQSPFRADLWPQYLPSNYQQTYMMVTLVRIDDCADHFNKNLIYLLKNIK